MALSTALEQNFKFLKECSKSEYITWHPTFASYQHQGGIKTLVQCMDPTVQNAFIFTLRLTRISFFASNSDELHNILQSILPSIHPSKRSIGMFIT